MQEIVAAAAFAAVAVVAVVVVKVGVEADVEEEASRRHGSSVYANGTSRIVGVLCPKTPT